MTDPKTLDQWLVIDWKSGSTRTRKSEPSSLGTHELATRLKIEIEIPEVQVPELAARIQVPAPMVQTAVLESLDEEDLPDWSDVAEEVLHEANAEEDVVEMEEPRVAAEMLATRVLVEFDGLAEASDVRDYLWRRIREEQDGGDGQ